MAKKETPTKIHKTLESSYSPVTCEKINMYLDGIIIKLIVAVPQNPGASSKNLTGLTRIAKDIAADVYNSIQKWNENHVQGAALVQKIIHTKFNDNKRFSLELEQLINELGETVCRLSVNSNSLTFLSKQISALTKLHKGELPLFITLSTQKFSNLIEDIAKAYKLELAVIIISQIIVMIMIGFLFRQNDMY